MKTKLILSPIKYSLGICGLIVAFTNMPGLFCDTKQDSALRSRTTEVIIAYLDALISKNILCAENLKSLKEHDILVNPIHEREAHSSDEIFAHWKQINGILDRIKNEYDLVHIKQWAQAKLHELEGQNAVRIEVHEKTKAVHLPMEFVEIPVGTYIDAVDQSEYKIEEGTEIQVTPVTQCQWAIVMEDNPSKNVEGIDAEEIVIGNKKIKMKADYPVENISYEDIEKLIEKLNEADQEYYYEVASLEEYQAVLQLTYGNAWSNSIKPVDGVSKIQKSSVTSNGYHELNKKRIWAIIGSVWVFTRDTMEMRETINKVHMVFGASHNTRNISSSMKALYRPVYYKDSKGADIGLRLVRCKKHERAFGIKMMLKMIFIGTGKNKTYQRRHVSWDQDDVKNDIHWHWDKTFNLMVHTSEILRFMMENKKGYSSEIQHTLEKVMREAAYDTANNPIGFIRSLTSRNLSDDQISDITPLAGLTNLTELFLGNNQIKDIAPLAELTNLTGLYLGNNQISDIRPLIGLINLTWLDLRGNQISDITPLTRLVNLAKLYLDRDQIARLKPHQVLNGNVEIVAS